MTATVEVTTDGATRRRSFASRARMTLGSLVAIVATMMPAAVFVATPPAAASGDANLVGTWKISGGYLGFTVKSENHRTGVCAGVTASPLYHLVGCRVTGTKYVFTITYGTSYRSKNSGTIVGNKILGTFKDSNGAVIKYTGVR